MALKDGRVIVWGSNLVGEAELPRSAKRGVVAIAAGGFQSYALAP